MRAGGTTSLAEHGVPPSIIQPLGRWSSEAYLVYVRKSPALIQAMLYSDRHFSQRPNSRSSSPMRSSTAERSSSRRW